MADSDVSGTDPVAQGASADTPTESKLDEATSGVAEAVSDDETPPSGGATPTDPLTAKVNQIADMVDKVLAAIDGLQASFVDGGGIVREDLTPGTSGATGINTAQGQTQDAASVNQTPEIPDEPIEELDFTL